MKKFFYTLSYSLFFFSNFFLLTNSAQASFFTDVLDNLRPSFPSILNIDFKGFGGYRPTYQIQQNKKPAQESNSNVNNSYFQEEENYDAENETEPKKDSSSQEKQKTSKQEVSKAETVSTPTYLEQVLEKIKNNSTNSESTGLTQQSFPTNPNSTQPLQSPIPTTPLGQLSSSVFGGGTGGQPGGLTPFGGGSPQMQNIFNTGARGILDFAQKICKDGGGTNCDQARADAGKALSQIQNGVKDLATPYNGPGGSITKDCPGFEKGPIAYNIRNKNGTAVSCNASSVVSGYMGNLRKDKFGIGYINPMRESGDPAPGTIEYKCQSCGDGEYRYPDYNSQDAVAYVQTQLLHWQKQGIAKGQACVPVDIDNCDAIGSPNYLKVLNQIQKFNNTFGIETKIMVLNKNPQNNCNYFSHPVVIGAFIEEISVEEAKKVAAMRSKPEQILLFAAGSGSKVGRTKGKEDDLNGNVRKIENSGIKNAAFSYDKGAEYQTVYDCTYKE